MKIGKRKLKKSFKTHLVSANTKRKCGINRDVTYVSRIDERHEKQWKPNDNNQ